MIESFDIKENHVYIGSLDKAIEWSGIKGEETNDEQRNNLITHIREKIKNYLQLDNVSFLFGTGSSIHLGAAGIQNIPSQVEKDIESPNMAELKEDFKKHVVALQKPMLDKYHPEKNKKFQDERGWDLIFDGTYIRNYEEENVKDEDADKKVEGENERIEDVSLEKIEDIPVEKMENLLDETIEDIQVESPKDVPDEDVSKHYGEILLQFELLLNYLTAMLFQKEAEKADDESKRIQDLITALKKSLFTICDVHGRETSEKDLKRIREKGLEEEFKRNKYLFHEKFLKSLMQRPLNLQRANIFTSNYDLAFEYAFDNLGVKYIDGFSGFHHRYFKPETFNYDIFYPGSTTAGKVQRIEKVVRYFKLHGSISWINDNQHTPSNIYGIEEMPIELIKMKAKEDNDSLYGNLMIYPTAVKKSYTLDLPYSELFRHFAHCISQPQSVLFTIGYSFYDEHFNDIIYQALSNPTFTLVIIDFNGCGKSAEIKRLKDLNDPRIIIIEGHYLGDFLTLANTLMPDFMDTSSEDKVTKTLNNLLNNKTENDGK